MTHPNETRLSDLYAVFAKGDLEGFLHGCTDDVTFHVPGATPFSGVYDRASFPDWIVRVLTAAEGTFQEHVLDVIANDHRGVLLLHHEFDRAGAHREYLTSHVCELRDGKISRWEERPGSVAEFEAAWGTADGVDPVALVHRIYEEVVNQGRIDATDELFAEDFVDHGPMGDLDGREEFKSVISRWRAAVPDVQCSVESVIVHGDMAAWLVRTTGTHTGGDLGFPTTGRTFETLSANIGRLRDGRAVEHWSEQGMLPMLVQLGVLPAPPG